MADFLLGNLSDWLNRLADVSGSEAVEPEARATLIASVTRHRCFACTALKPDPTSPAGIALSRNHRLSEAEGWMSTYINVSKMTDDSLFVGSGLEIGMQVCSINNQVPRTPGDAAQMIRGATRVVTMIAHRPTPGLSSQHHHRLGESLVAATVELSSAAAEEQRGTATLLRPDDLLRDLAFQSLPLTTDVVYVSRVAPHSPFDRHDPPLRAGMVVHSINNVRVRNVTEAMECIHTARHFVTILTETMQIADHNSDHPDESSSASMRSSRRMMIDSLPLAEVIIPDCSDDHNVDSDWPVQMAVPAIAAAPELRPHVLPATALIRTGQEEAAVSSQRHPPLSARESYTAQIASSSIGMGHRDARTTEDDDDDDDDDRAVSSTTTTTWHEAAMTMRPANNNSSGSNDSNDDDEVLSSDSSGSERNVDYEQRGGGGRSTTTATEEEENYYFASSSENCFEV
jgi:hypothetical protein